MNKLKVDRRELEAAIARIDELSKQIGDLRSRLDIGPAGLAPLQAYQQQQAGRHEGITSSSELGMRIVQILIAALALIVTAYLATHG